VPWLSAAQLALQVEVQPDTTDYHEADCPWLVPLVDSGAVALREAATLTGSGCEARRMSPDPVRHRQLDHPCPGCGAPLAAREIGIMVAELPEPVRWATDRRYCSRGCLLTIDDFPNGEPD